MNNNCNTNINYNTTYDCAVICYKNNDIPIAKIKYEKDMLFQKSTFFDNNNISDREFKWIIKNKDFIIKEIGWGKLNQKIPNYLGSTYGSLKLGKNNLNIKNYIINLPNTYYNNEEITIVLLVKDSSGIISKESNKYKF